MAETRTAYTAAGGGADRRLEHIVYTRFLDPDARKGFFSDYKEIESLWEILSPSAELRDHIDTFKRLAHLYAVVRNAYADRPAFVAELAHKTQRLVEESAAMYGLGNLTKAVTFDLRTCDTVLKIYLVDGLAKLGRDDIATDKSIVAPRPRLGSAGRAHGLRRLRPHA